MGLVPFYRKMNAQSQKFSRTGVTVGLCVALIMLCFAITIFVRNSFAINKSHDAVIASVSNLKQLHNALMNYAIDHNNTLPPMVDVLQFKQMIYPHYLTSDSCLISPLDGVAYSINASTSKATCSTVSINEVLIYETTATYQHRNTSNSWDKGRCVLFFGGKATWVNEAEWSRLRLPLQIQTNASGGKS